MGLLGGLLRTEKAPVRLHVGAGDKHLDGWINLDLKRLPGVDRVIDVSKGLPFSNVEAIFAEHFLEHLAVQDALAFMSEARRVLRADGWLRLSTPNLDWVWRSHYRDDAPRDEKPLAAVRLNRAFHGWGHRFLWNQELLGWALEASGFRELRWCRYGESELELLRGLERHETYDDTPELPHVIIAEARRGEPDSGRLAALRRLLTQDFLDHLDA